MNAKISVFVICVETIIYLSLYNLHDCTFFFNYFSFLYKFSLFKSCNILLFKITWAAALNKYRSVLKSDLFKTLAMAYFQVQLQVWGLTALQKANSKTDAFLWNLFYRKFYRTKLLKKTAEQLLLISSNVLDVSLVLIALNQLIF